MPAGVLEAAGVLSGFAVSAGALEAAGVLTGFAVSAGALEAAGVLTGFAVSAGVLEVSGVLSGFAVSAGVLEVSGVLSGFAVSAGALEVSGVPETVGFIDGEPGFTEAAVLAAGVPATAEAPGVAVETVLSASFTVILQLSLYVFLFFKVTLQTSFVFPSFKAVTTPFLLTRAIFFFLTVNLIFLIWDAFLFLMASFFFWPTLMVSFFLFSFGFVSASAWNGAAVRIRAAVSRQEIDL